MQQNGVIFSTTIECCLPAFREEEKEERNGEEKEEDGEEKTIYRSHEKNRSVG
jgi:hypothetical protein